MTTARGVKATTTTTLEQGSTAPVIRPAQIEALHKGNVHGTSAGDAATAALLSDETTIPPLLRRRSRSVDLSMTEEAPPSMTVIGSCNEDGHGLVSWWC